MPPHKPFDCETAYTQEKKRRDNGARGAAFARGLLLSACGPLRCLDICEQRIGPGQLACTDGLLRVSDGLLQAVRGFTEFDNEGTGIGADLSRLWNVETGLAGRLGVFPVVRANNIGPGAGGRSSDSDITRR